MAAKEPQQRTQLELLGAMMADVFREALRQIKDGGESLFDQPDDIAEVKAPDPISTIEPGPIEEIAALSPDEVATPVVPDREFAEPAPTVDTVGQVDTEVPPPEVPPPRLSSLAEPPGLADAMGQVDTDEPLPEVTPAAKAGRTAFDPGFGPMIVPMEEPDLPSDAFGDIEADRLAIERANADDPWEDLASPARDFVDENDKLVNHMINVMDELTRRAGNHIQRIVVIENSAMRHHH